MTRAEVLDFALHNGLNNTDSEEFADEFKNKPKAQVINELLDTHKIIAMKNLARRYGLPEVDVRAFTKENKNKTLEEAAKILDNQIDEIAKKREALVNELTAIAKEKGLDDWEANNFAYRNLNTERAKALEELNKLAIEKAERETKLNELIKLAKEKGLEDWEASNFANNYINNERAEALKELDKLAAEKEKKHLERLQAEKETQIRELAEQYRIDYFPNVYNFNAWDFVEKYKDKTVEEAKKELESIKAHREKLVELAKTLTELQVSDYDIEKFINDNTLLTLDESKSNLEAKITDAINRLKAGGPYGTPLNKALGFLAKEDLTVKKSPIVENDRETDKFTTTTTYSDIYNQKYSVITGKFEQVDREAKEARYEPNSTIFTHYEDVVHTTKRYNVSDPQGFTTAVDKFPSEGKATYTGVAFDSQKHGKLSYTVNFTDKKGSGKITGLDHFGNITLQEADIYKSVSNNDMRVKGNAIAEAWVDEGGVTGEYTAIFFGPNAEEVAGKMSLEQGPYKDSNDPNGSYFVAPDKHIRDVTISNSHRAEPYNYPRGDIDIGFGGTRGEIQK